MALDGESLLFRKGGMPIMDILSAIANLCTIVEFLSSLIKYLIQKNDDKKK